MHIYIHVAITSVVSIACFYFSSIDVRTGGHALGSLLLELRGPCLPTGVTVESVQKISSVGQSSFPVVSSSSVSSVLFFCSSACTLYL